LIATPDKQLAFQDWGRHFASMKSSLNSIEFCQQMVRRDDRDRFDTCLFAPSDVQPKLWTLYAFNQEIAKTRDSVSEPALGEIRLQWWRDALEEVKAGRGREHPVVQAVEDHLNSPKLLGLLGQLIDAREADLFDEGPASFDALRSYAEGAGGILAELALMVSINDPSSALLERARRTGAAWAMLGLVRAVPFHWADNRTYLPGEEGRSALAATSADTMYELAKPALDQMLSFSAEVFEGKAKEPVLVPGPARHVFLLDAIGRQYLSQLKKADGNPFKMTEVSDFKRLWLLFITSLSGRSSKV
jgi:phytoene synthase